MMTHSQRLERWLGAETVEHLSRSMRGWYGPPIAVAGVPGNVRVCGDGDFIGEVRAGWEMSALDRAADLVHRVRRGWRRSVRRAPYQLNAGFASLSDLIAEATAGKRREFLFQKVGAAATAVGDSKSFWGLGNFPPAGTAPAAAAAGTAFVDSSTGGFQFDNPTGGDTQHFVQADHLASVAGNSLLLYDLIFGVAKLMNSTATEAVTGVPTRYQNQTGGTADYIGGNFLFIQVGGTVLPATAHNWTVCLYTDEAGVSSTLPSVTGVSAGIIHRLDMPTQQWFCPLAAGDLGIKALTQMQCSALVATGVISDLYLDHR
jgi:hypothetical protein